LQGTYRITRLLGSGGYGAVYQAEQTHLGNVPCAIKELQPDPKATPQQIQKAAEQFQLEASLLAGLNHPSLPRVTNFFAEGGRYYLVMDYVEGETLEERLERNRGPLSEAQVLVWADELCDVLTYLHTRQPSPVIHRDVKPANIKITPDGRLKLIDFGISKVLAKGTGDAARAVSPPYSPLEQYGKGISTDARSDIYALGVTLYQLLTNHLPPHAPDRLNETLILPRQLNPAVSPMTEAVILKAIEEKPAGRHQNAEEMKWAFKTPPANPFLFRGGGQARNLQELVRLCESEPQDAIWHLEHGYFEPWLTAIGPPDLARAASDIKERTGTSEQRLNWFLDATGLPHTYIVLPEPPSPPPPPPPPPPSSGCNKSAWAWLAAAAIVVGAVIFGFQEISRQQAAEATAIAQALATATARTQAEATATTQACATATAQTQATTTAQAQATATAQAQSTATAQAQAQATATALARATATAQAQARATATVRAQVGVLTTSSKSPFKDLTFGRGGIDSETRCWVKENATTVSQASLIDDSYFYFAMPFRTSDIGKKIYWSLAGSDSRATRNKVEREMASDDNLCFWQGFSIDPIWTPGQYTLEITADSEVVYRYAFTIQYADIASRRPKREPFGRFAFGRGGWNRSTCSVGTPTDRVQQADFKDDEWLYFASSYTVDEIGQVYYWTVYKPDGSTAFDRRERTLQDAFWLCAWQGFGLGETPGKGRYRLVIESKSRTIYEKVFFIE
jgi:serine/threonine-protein kinase